MVTNFDKVARKGLQFSSKYNLKNIFMYYFIIKINFKMVCKCTFEIFPEDRGIIYFSWFKTWISYVMHFDLEKNDILSGQKHS
jgi:hypothetical protein